MKKLFIALVLSVCSFAVLAEGNPTGTAAVQTVSFRVMDADQEAIAGAEVKIPELNITVYTDLDGNFKTEVPAGFNGDITISFISYEDKVLKVSDIADKKIQLREE